jgi:tyrosyl-tRNA synthetase
MSNQSITEILSRGVAEVLPSAESLPKLMATKKIRVYLGIDPTGSLLTLGHSVVLRKLQQFAEAGHEVILLIGNGTVKIGDPTGRDSTRPELTDAQIEENFKDWQAQASKILDFSKIKILHNGDWLDKLTYADMVKLLAKTTVQQLIERDMFQDRLKNGLPIFGHEIIYPLLQGYDSVAMDVDLEIGGTDQTFNMMMGRTLQKAYNNHEKWVLTTPIINGTDGRKMSKSYGNFVALTEAPNEMFGKLMSISDSMIIDYFTLLTDTSVKEINEMANKIKQGENPMELKKKLALTITQMYHSAKEAAAAQEHFEKTVQSNELPDEMTEVKVNVATIRLDELVKLCLPQESNSNIRRLIEQGAVKLMPAGNKPTNFAEIVSLSSIEVIRIGKRKYFKLLK